MSRCSVRISTVAVRPRMTQFEVITECESSVGITFLTSARSSCFVIINTTALTLWKAGIKLTDRIIYES